MTEVVDVTDGSVRHEKFRVGNGWPNHVYIGRENNSYNFSQSKYHNPFRKEDYGRDECIRRFEDYFHDRIEKDSDFKKSVERLQGKTLGCWCGDTDCHGDVIADYLDTRSILDYA